MQQLKINSFLYVIAVSILSAIYIMPSVRIMFDYTSLAVILFLFYMVFIFKLEGFIPIKTIMVNLLPYMLVSFLVAKQGDFKLGFLHPLLITWCMLFPGILCKDIIKRGNIKEAILILTITMSMLVYIMYNTINAFAVSENIMRELTAVSTMDDQVRISYANANIGGFGIAYGSGAVVVLLITLIFNKFRNRRIEIITYLLLAFFIYFVLNAQFTTLLLLTIFCSLLTLYYSDYGQRNKGKVIVLCILLFLFAPLLFQILADLYQGTTIGNKLIRFNVSVFGGGDITEASGQRSKFQIDAFNLFLSSPLWGGNVTDNMTNATIYGASHSTMLGVACSTGIIGLLSYYKTYWAIMKPIFKNYTGNGKQYITLVLYFFCFSCFNPSEAPEACWIIFLIVPLLFNLFNHRI